MQSPTGDKPSTTTTSGPPRTGYRTLLASADTSFVVLAAAARLPTAMLPLGILLYVADRTGSYGSGGLAVAALSIGGGIGGPLVGMAADHAGQRIVALGATLVQVLGLTALLVISDSAGLGVVLVAAAAVGLANPQAGAMARSRWASMAKDRTDRGSYTATAMAWEGAVDETSFVVGPVLVGTVAGVVSPTAALVLALVLAATTQSAFGAHRSALPGRTPAGRLQDEARAPLPLARFTCLLLAMGAVGVVFGATQTGVAARMAENGTAGSPVRCTPHWGSARPWPACSRPGCPPPSRCRPGSPWAERCSSSLDCSPHPHSTRPCSQPAACCWGSRSGRCWSAATPWPSAGLPRAGRPPR